jgi:hypothetical protein
MGVLLPRTSSECPKDLISVSFSGTRLSLLGTRGFASPDYSGFAFIGVSLLNFHNLNNLAYLLCNPIKKKTIFHIKKKGLLYFYKPDILSIDKYLLNLML